MTRPAAGTEIPIPVTQAHLDRAIPGDPNADAVALAAADAIPGAGSACSCYTDPPEYAYVRVWTGPSSWLRLVLGQAGHRFMLAADHGEPVQPCTLTAVVA